MKTLSRLLYRLVCWINYPTSRERMWGMYALGKAQGIKEALKTLPIVQVQPRQTAKVVSEPLHLPSGMLTRQWRETHTEHRATILSQPTYWPEPFVSAPNLDPYNTEEMPAVVKLLHERRYETRKLG